MSTTKPLPIAGVSAGRENEVMTIYPSMAAMGFGRALGRLYDSIPIRIHGIKLSHLLFCVPTNPIPLVTGLISISLYFWMKLAGQRYMITNRSLQIWQSLGQHLLSQVALAEIDRIDIEQRPGQAFYRASDLIVIGAGGAPLMRLGGVPRAEVFRQTILKARDARTQVESSLVTIQARRPA